MRMEKLDLNLLIALDVMLETRNISAAARQLNFSQSALSGALGRLRLFFEDELLVQRGRQMVPTPKAEELAGPIRQVLMLIRSQITTPARFEPSEAERRFRIITSDYAYDVLLADALVRASTLAPKISFEVIPAGYASLQRLEQGEIDLFVSISSYLAEAHPSRDLFEDRHAVVAWAQNPEVGAELDRETYLRLGHVAVRFGGARARAYTEDYFTQVGINRRIEAIVPGFSSVPASIVGTHRLATVWRRHAEHFARLYPLSIYEPPIDMPHIREGVQWHTVRDKDEGLQWLIGLISDEARKLA